jgi:hypothetical protein
MTQKNISSIEFGPLSKVALETGDGFACTINRLEIGV